MSSPSSSEERKKVADHIDDPNELAAQEVESKPSRADGKNELTEHEAYDKLGFSFPTWKKWLILTVIFWVQMSMNFNTSKTLMHLLRKMAYMLELQVYTQTSSSLLRRIASMERSQSRALVWAR